jgi:hypothetical protein
MIEELITCEIRINFKKISREAFIAYIFQVHTHLEGYSPGGY